MSGGGARGALLVSAGAGLRETLMPARFARLAPTLCAFRQRLGVTRVLVTLRMLVEPIVSALPVPLGLHRRSTVREEV